MGDDEFCGQNLKFLFNLKKKKRKHYEDLLFYVTLGAFLCMSMSVVNHKKRLLILITYKKVIMMVTK